MIDRSDDNMHVRLSRVIHTSATETSKVDVSDLFMYTCQQKNHFTATVQWPVTRQLRAGLVHSNKDSKVCHVVLRQ
jgi:hypothetical protein